jgi:phosphopantetheinyl transferase
MSTKHHSSRPALSSGEVHLWSLPDDPSCLDRLRVEGIGLLSASENQRFNDFKHPHTAERFLLGRILLRKVLAQYLDMNPAAFEFYINKNGKPELDQSIAQGLSFNLSHTAATVVLAVAQVPAIGIDIETVARAGKAYRIAQHFFSPLEQRRLRVAGKARAHQALMLWGLKESIAKAQGCTIWRALTNVSLAIEGPRIRWLFPPGEDGLIWRLAAGNFRKDFVFSLARALPPDQADEPLRVRTFRLGTNSLGKNAFELVCRS